MVAWQQLPQASLSGFWVSWLRSLGSGNDGFHLQLGVAPQAVRHCVCRSMMKARKQATLHAMIVAQGRPPTLAPIIGHY